MNDIPAVLWFWTFQIPKYPDPVDLWVWKFHIPKTGIFPLFKLKKKDQMKDQEMNIPILNWQKREKRKKKKENFYY